MPFKLLRKTCLTNPLVNGSFPKVDKIIFMAEFPFEIPKSLLSYCEQFEDKPKKATDRLHKHLKKRGLDPVGYMLLSWFYYLDNEHDKAIETALKAKVYAPGSNYLSLLHYFFSHPNNMEAWVPEYQSTSGKKDIGSSPKKGSQFNIDLEKLIKSLTDVDRVQTSTSKTEAETDTNTNKDLSDNSDQADDVITETLAKIHKSQGKYKEAIRTYRSLITLYPDKEDYYRKHIEQLEQQIKGE